MATAHKHIRPKTGRDSHRVDKWTTLRPGPLHEQKDTARADMFVDVSPYVSIAGIDADRLYSRRGATHIDDHAIARTRGVTLRGGGKDRQREHMIAGPHRKGKKQEEY